MRFLDSRILQLILLACIPLFFLPKINLVSLGGMNAGLRVDDLVLFGVGAIILAGHALVRQPFVPLEWTILLLTCSGWLSILLNRCFLGLEWSRLGANPLFVARLIEYFTFFYVGWAASKVFSMNRIMRWMIGVTAVVMLLQWAGLLGAFTVKGYVPVTDGRPCGLVAHPAEVSLLLNMAVGYLIFSSFSASVVLVGTGVEWRCRSRLLWIVLLFVLILLSGSRIALLGALVICALVVYQSGYWRRPAVLIGILFTLASLIALLAMSGKLMVVERSLHLFSMTNLEMIPKLYQTMDIENQTFLDASVVSLNGDVDYDVSWFMRIHKWVFILKYYIHHPMAWLFGLGPGVCLDCLDGSYLRILTENGLVGLLLYGWLFYSIAKQSPALLVVVTVFAINMIFIDSYISYKPMALLFLLSGYDWGREHRQAVNRDWPTPSLAS